MRDEREADLPTNGSVNSEEAAAVHKPDAPNERVAIYRWLVENGPHTDEEIEEKCPAVRRSSRVRTRRNELRDRYLVEALFDDEAGQWARRPTRTGCSAQVWRAVVKPDAEILLAMSQSMFLRRPAHVGRTETR